MPESVPRWVLIAAGLVALITILVGVKDFAERKSASNPPSRTDSATVVHPESKSAPKAAGKRKGTRGPATAVNESVAETLPADAPGRFPIMEGIVQAGARAPLVPDDSVNKGQLGPIESKGKTPPTRCAPLPNSTKPEDVDATYYLNWAREYGCGSD
jgi:hypothetical protein